MFYFLTILLFSSKHQQNLVLSTVKRNARCVICRTVTVGFALEQSSMLIDTRKTGSKNKVGLLYKVCIKKLLPFL